MQRLLFAILACFWLFMTWQLWRVEYAGQKLGAAVQIDTVWDKVRRAPDDSLLQIVHAPSGRLLGSLEWEPKLITETVSEVEGQVTKIDGYELAIDSGVFLLGSDRGELRFNFDLVLDPQSEWETVRLSLNKVDASYANELNLSALATASNQVLKIGLQLPQYTNEISMPLEDMRDPRKFSEAILKLRGAGKLTTMTTLFAVNKLLDEANFGSPLNFSFRLPTEAHLDRLPGVRSDIKVYRVDFAPVEGWTASVYVNPVGEILLVRLPQGYELRNPNYYGIARRRKQ